MLQLNLIQLNTEVELAEDWAYNHTVSWCYSDNTILEIAGATVPRNSDGSYRTGAVVPVVIPRGVRILIRKYDLNQGNANGCITVTIRMDGRSPKIKVTISEINKLKYNTI